jgi:hypothetical protein
VTYVRRSATQGGVAPATACGAGNVDMKVLLDYRADCVFYKAS